MPTTYKNKPYSEELKQQFDPKAKEYFLDFIKNDPNIELIEDNDKEGIIPDYWDLKIKTKSDKILKVEVEVKVEPKIYYHEGFATKERPYPFRYHTLDIPYRKIKNSSDLYYQFNEQGTFCFYSLMSVIKKHGNKYSKYCRNSNMNEDFFGFPLNLIDKYKIFYKKDDVWRVWKS